MATLSVVLPNRFAFQEKTVRWTDDGVLLIQCPREIVRDPPVFRKVALAVGYTMKYGGVILSGVPEWGPVTKPAKGSYV